MTTVTNEISKFEVGKIYLTDSDVANGTTDSKTKVISREGDLVKFQHLASGAQFEQIAFELGAGEVCEGYPQRGENIHETLSASNSFEVENEMTTEINNLTAVEDTVKMNDEETAEVTMEYPSWYEVKAVVASIAEKHGFEVDLTDSWNWIKFVGSDSIEVKCRDSFVSGEITKYFFEYHSSSTHTFKTASEVTDFANAVNQLKNFAEEIESLNLNNVFCREGGDKSNGWILENGDARAFQFYIELIQREIAWTERSLNDELTKYLPENDAKMEEAERELTSLQNSRKKGKKIDRRITELSRDIKSLKERIADSPVRVQQYQDKIAVLQEEIQQVKKWANPDELPELLSFQVTESTDKDIDASEYVISVDAQDVAINAERGNAQTEVVAVNSENAAVTEEVPAEPEEKNKKFYVIGYHYYDYRNGCCPAFAQVLNETFEDFGDAINRAREFWDEKSDKMKGKCEEDYRIMVTDENISSFTDETKGKNFYRLGGGYCVDSDNDTRIVDFRYERVLGDNEVYDEDKSYLTREQEEVLYALAEKFNATTKIDFWHIKPYAEEVEKTDKSEEKIYSLAEVKAILEQKITEYGFKVKYSGFGLIGDQFFDPKEPENHLPNTDKICGFGHSYRDGESWHCAFITTLTEFVAENIFKVKVECGIPSIFGDRLTPAEMLKAAEEMTRAAHLAEVIQSLNLNFRFEYDAEKKQVA